MAPRSANRLRSSRAAALVALSLVFCMNAHCADAPAALPQPTAIVVNGTQLHYIELGQGEPLILLHGGQGDYRAWTVHMAELARRYRVISYSRRYHYPNQNPLTSRYSARVDADDLAQLIRALGLGPVHLVGTSYGAFVALALAVEQPRLVRTMVLAEAPVLQWANATPHGAELYQDFLQRTHVPAAAAFARGDEVAAVRDFIDAFDGVGTFDKLPPERRNSILQNAGYFRAITAARDPYPDLSRRAVSRIRRPALVVRGEQTHELDVIVANEVAAALHAKVAVIPGAGHGSPRTHPQQFLSVVTEFLAQSGR